MTPMNHEAIGAVAILSHHDTSEPLPRAADLTLWGFLGDVARVNGKP